jgi:hypothetical protein
VLVQANGEIADATDGFATRREHVLVQVVGQGEHLAAHNYTTV